MRPLIIVRQRLPPQASPARPPLPAPVGLAYRHLSPLERWLARYPSWRSGFSRETNSGRPRPLSAASRVRRLHRGPSSSSARRPLLPPSIGPPATWRPPEPGRGSDPGALVFGPRLRLHQPPHGPGLRATAGMPSYVAKQVARPIRNREAPIPEPHLE